MKKVTLDIERKWGTQSTVMSIYSNGEDEKGNAIRLSTPLRDFMKSVKEEIGSVTFTFKQKTFEQQFDLAVKNVLKEIGKNTGKYATSIHG